MCVGRLDCKTYCRWNCRPYAVLFEESEHVSTWLTGPTIKVPIYGILSAGVLYELESRREYILVVTLIEHIGTLSQATNLKSKLVVEQARKVEATFPDL